MIFVVDSKSGLTFAQTLDAELAGTIPVNSTMQSKVIHTLSLVTHY